MQRHAMTLGLLIILLCTMGSANSEVAPVQLGVKLEMFSERALSSDIESADLPAISADRKEVAVLHYSGDDYQAVSVDIFSASSSKRLKRFTLVTQNQGRQRTSDAKREALWDKLIAPNQYLARKGFVRMTPLYSIEWRDNPPQAKDLLPSFAHVRFERQTGEVTITAAGNGRTLLRMRRPVIDRTGDSPDSPTSASQQVPVEGWLDNSSHKALLRLETSTSAEITYLDEWKIVTLK